jgi:hypothetical protein
MRRSRDEITQNLAAQFCWKVARRNDARMARRLSRRQFAEGVYRWDKGDLAGDPFHFLPNVAVMALCRGHSGDVEHDGNRPYGRPRSGDHAAGSLLRTRCTPGRPR